MKTRNRFLAAQAAPVALCALFCMAALAGCDNGFAPQDAETAGRKGAVRVVVDNGRTAQADNRTAVPSEPGFAYTLTFTAPGKPTATFSLDGNEGEVLLDAGTWTLAVVGKLWEDIVAESDPIAVTIPAEGNAATISVTVRPALNGANGNFSYRINTNGALTDVSATLTPLDVGSAAQSEAALTIGTNNVQSVSVSPGYYRLTVRARKGSQTLVRRETVHIYSHSLTAKYYTLTDSDFAPAVYFAGTLTGGIDGYTATKVSAYGDAECFWDIGESGATGGAWGMEVEGLPETVHFKVRLAKDGAATSAAYYSKPFSISGVSAVGRTDVAIAVEGYTVTFDANGGAFEGGGSTVTRVAPENGAVEPPSAPQDEREFLGWFFGGRGFTAKTPITGDTTVYARWPVGLEDLADAPGGHSPDSAYQVALNTDLANGGWEGILSAVHASGKYVALDLSACAMSGVTFNPGFGGAGADKVVGLTLPNAAESIQAGDFDNSTFKDFTVLASISGRGVKTVGDYAFRDCASLAELNLPAATSIGERAFSSCGISGELSLPVATSIGQEAFYDCTELVSVNLPAAKDIYKWAFMYTGITELSLPAATGIAYGVFQGCSNLTSVSLPVATFIGGVITAYGFEYGAFYGCTSLTSVSLPAVTSIGEVAFAYCTSLTSVDLPATTSIGEKAFEGCRNLTSANLPAVATIDNQAFYECESFASVSLSATLTAIGDDAFYGCNNLTSITVDPANTAFSARNGMLLNKAETTLFAGAGAYGDITLPNVTDVLAKAFYGAKLTSVSLPAATSIGEAAFAGCTSLTSVSLPAATDIGDAAFFGCGISDELSLPVATSIGERAFRDCASLTEASLPAMQSINDSPYFNDGIFYGCVKLRTVDISSVAYIGKYAFYGCAALETVDMSATTDIGDYAFMNCTNLMSASLPAAASIGDSAFSWCAGLTSVSLPVATSIGEAAFAGCTSLTSVSLPAVTAIGGSTFSQCWNLATLSLPAVTSISDHAFYQCWNLTTVNMPPVPSISDYAFYMCSNLTEVNLSIAASIGDYAFYHCESLTSVSLPVATSIGDSAFYYCASLTSVSLPVATSIGESAFATCDISGELSLPAATSIGDYAFYNCESLTSVSFPVAASIGESAFDACRNLISVSLPAATHIGAGAFQGRPLTSISLPAATFIGDSAFSGCTNLTSANLPAAQTIGRGAFFNCANLAAVNLPATPPTKGDNIFYGTGSGSSGAITIAVPAGAVPAYTTAWGVSAETPASGNATGPYGFNHKAVTITDAAQ